MHVRRGSPLPALSPIPQAIILQYVSRPLCGARDDWGGVPGTDTWWKEARRRYRWDVTEGIEIRPSKLLAYLRRYDVKLRKRGKRGPAPAPTPAPPPRVPRVPRVPP